MDKSDNMLVWNLSILQILSHGYLPAGPVKGITESGRGLASAIAFGFSGWRETELYLK